MFRTKGRITDQLFRREAIIEIHPPRPGYLPVDVWSLRAVVPSGQPPIRVREPGTDWTPEGPQARHFEHQGGRHLGSYKGIAGARRRARALAADAIRRYGLDHPVTIVEQEAV